jgi:mannose-6-phosphate isomerase-like protein (cupin superfamily)
MADYSIKRIADMEGIYAGHFKRARAELGVESFGMQVIDIPPGAHQYPEHDHAEDGQEEVYIALRGDGEIEIEGDRHRLDPETMVRVGPGVRRKLWPGEQGMRVLALGGRPGAPYEPPAMSKLGEPDPLATAGR